LEAVFFCTGRIFEIRLQMFLPWSKIDLKTLGWSTSDFSNIFLVQTFKNLFFVKFLYQKFSNNSFKIIHPKNRYKGWKFSFWNMLSDHQVAQNYFFVFWNVFYHWFTLRGFFLLLFLYYYQVYFDPWFCRSEP
jgi:hypothetical protein